MTEILLVMSYFTALPQQGKTSQCYISFPLLRFPTVCLILQEGKKKEY